MEFIAANSCPALSGASASLFETLITTIFAAQCVLDTSTLYPKDCGPGLKHGDEFDFIIVGGGNAGSVLASRLSEIAHYRILLLEAGGIPSSTTEVPALATKLFGTSEDWNFRTEQSDGHCNAFVDGRCTYWKGKMLGGSSSIDLMTYFRGNKRDFDGWNSLGWRWDDVLPYFKKSQDMRKPELKNNPLYGVGGYLPTSPVEAQSYFAFLKNAAREMGFSVNDYSKNIGFIEALLTVADGRRVSTAKAFLGPVKTRSNLCVALNAHVTKIIIDDYKIATGVIVKISQRTISLNTKKEVIISAGTINSAQLLMLSGIGPKDQLINLNIKVIKELPVGFNLQDHLCTMGVIMRFDDYPGLREESTGTIHDILQYFTEFKGTLSTSTINLHSFFNTENNSIYPNFYTQHSYFPKNDSFLMADGLQNVHFNNVSRQSLLDFNKNHHMMMLAMGLLNPKSSGRVVLKSSNPFEKALIKAGYLSNNDDIDAFLEAIQFAKLYMQTPTLKNLNAALVDFEIPGCDNIPFDSREYWECNLKSLGGSLSRPVGTCKMGSQNDKTAVVDDRLKVYGIKNLRVVGSSIMPKIVSANSNAATIMIAEKAADMIKLDW